jgi:RimJ/RimL family protein N-acetyltransferase
LSLVLRANCSFRFLAANRCTAEQLASVYPDREQARQLRRFASFLSDISVSRRFFVLAVCHDKTAALLHLCAEQRRPAFFKIRGLYTHPDFRNRSLATHILQLGCMCLTEFYQVQEIRSFILPTNGASLAAHENAGFFPDDVGGGGVRRHRCFICQRSIF